MAGLLGQRDELLRLIEAAFPETRIAVQGNQITVEGPDAERVARLFDELVAGARVRPGARRRQGGPDHRHGARRPAPLRGAQRRGAARRPGAGTVRPNTAGPEALHRRHRRQHRHLRHRPGRHRQVVPGGGPGRPGPPVPPGRTGSSSPGRRWRPASGWASCPATSWPRSTPTCAPSTTPSTTCSSPRGPSACSTGAPSRWRRWPSCGAGPSTARFIILDEAQNTTPEQMKMFLTRIGFGSKCVVTGDVTQIDVPGGRSGLVGPGAGARRGRRTSPSCT